MARFIYRLYTFAFLKKSCANSSHRLRNGLPWRGFCDPTQAAYDYQEGYWSWKNYVNFTGKNRRYEVYKTYHFLAGK